MSQELVISSNPIETTLAVLEDDRLVEIYVEHHARKAITGSIYKGRVTRVLPGMQSAFVDLGLKRDAFLYVTDVLDPADGFEAGESTEQADREPFQPVPDADESQEEPERRAVRRDAEDRAEGDDEQPSRRRSRRRRRGGRGSDRPDEESPAASDSERPARSARTVLPGESIAKYGDTGQDNETETPAPESVSEERPSEEGGLVPGLPAGMEDDTARGPERADEAHSPDPEDRASDDEDEAPPESSASVRPPSLLSEFRFSLFGWGRKKGKKDDAKAEDASKGSERSRGAPSRRRRRSRSARAEAAPESRRRPSRRLSSGRPSRERRSQSRGSGEGSSSRGGPSRRAMQPAPDANIKDLLKVDQDVIVQVTKEPVGTKGARITSHVALPGRYMVYQTTATKSGVAKKIQPESERARLRRIIDEHSDGKPGGFIVRSVSRDVSEEDFVADIEFLQDLWDDLQKKAEKRRAPSRLHSDLDISERVLRDKLGQEFKTIWVDSEDEYERVLRFVERFQPDLVERVKLYTRQQPIFDAFGVTKDLEKALKSKVWLKSGGFIVIDQTEALVAVDVNTGRYTGKTQRLEDTVLKTNLEAVDEIVRQLRLRDLGGIIVIDFIDMEDAKNRQKVDSALQEALRKTRSPSRVLPINEFGMAVITRKAVRQSLERAMCVPCSECSGYGRVKSSSTVLSEIFAEADRVAADGKRKNGDSGQELTLRVHPEIAKLLKLKSNNHLEDLEAAVGASVLVRSDSSLHPSGFTLG